MDDELFKIYKHNKQFSGKKNPLKGLPACYLILHLDTDKAYVGSTNDLSRRCNENLKDLRNNEHKNSNLQIEYNKSPNIAIVYHPCQNVTEAQFIEQKIVDELDQKNLVFNIATNDVLLTRKGCKLSEEHKEALRKSNENRIVTEESKQKMSESQKRFFNTEEGKLRVKEIQKLHGKLTTIDGVTYPSVNEASKVLGIPYTTLNRRLNKK